MSDNIIDWLVWNFGIRNGLVSVIHQTLAYFSEGAGGARLYVDVVSIYFNITNLTNVDCALCMPNNCD